MTTLPPTRRRSRPRRPAAPEPPRPAATIVVVRDGARGIEVLLSRRAEARRPQQRRLGLSRRPVDAARPRRPAVCAGLDDAQASARLGSTRAGSTSSSPRCANASRNPACCSDARPARAPVDSTRAAERLAPWRGALHRGERRGRVCSERGPAPRCRPARLPEPLADAARPGEALRHALLPRAAPPSQIALHDGTELVEQLWLRPAEALARSATLKLLTPTQKTLEPARASRASPRLLAWAARRAMSPLDLPHIATGSQGSAPGAAGRAGLCRARPHRPRRPRPSLYESCRAAVRLSQRLIRVTADNGSVMTGPGTNTYLVGGGDGDEWAVIDPGPRSRRMSRRSSTPRRGRSRASS